MTGYRIEALDGRDDGLPLVVAAAGNADPEALCDWLRERPDWVQDRLTAHGAVLFRGFAVSEARTFERMARAIDPELKNEYLGTSPRDVLTAYTFSASELPPFYPIPQHCEMSFTASPPRRVFFCCLGPPQSGGGETPLVDFRKVWRDLPPDVRKRFEEGGIRIVRNYAGPGAAGRLNPFQLKGWADMFQTTDRARVEATCREQGFEATWTDGDGLRLVSSQPVTRDHPLTGETVWYNHVTSFHVSAASGEYDHIVRLRPTLRNRCFRQLARVLVALQRRRPSDEMAMQCTYLDGSEIPDADLDAVRDTVWRHLVVEPWQHGDVVAIDNFAVAHGRLPYRGPRQVAVAWA